MPLLDGDDILRGYARILRDDTEQKILEDERDAILAVNNKHGNKPNCFVCR